MKRKYSGIIVIILGIYIAINSTDVMSSSVQNTVTNKEQAIKTQIKIINFKKILRINRQLNKCLEEKNISLRKIRSSILHKEMKNLDKKTRKYCKSNQRERATHHYKRVMKDYNQSENTRIKDSCLKKQGLTRRELNEMSLNAIGKKSTGNIYEMAYKDGHICDKLKDK